MSDSGQIAGHDSSFPQTQPQVGVAERSHEWVRSHLDEAGPSHALEGGGTLSEEDRRDLEAHLRECRTCRAYQRSLQRTVELLRSLPPVKAPAEAKRRVLDSLP